MNALLLDLDDTLLDYSGGVDDCWRGSCETVAMPAGLDAAALVDAIAAARVWFWSDPERQRRERTDMVGAWTKIAAHGLSRLGIEGDGLARRIAEEFADRRCAAERLFPEALATLEWLRERGVPLGLVTNGDARLQRGKITRHGLARFFDVMVIEGEFGCGKPDERVFRHALEALRATPRDAWMVGDHLTWDIDGAQRVGLGAIWIDRARGGVPPGSIVRPDRVIHALDELRSLVR